MSVSLNCILSDWLLNLLKSCILGLYSSIIDHLIKGRPVCNHIQKVQNGGIKLICKFVSKRMFYIFVPQLVDVQSLGSLQVKALWMSLTLKKVLNLEI